MRRQWRVPRGAGRPQQPLSLGRSGAGWISHLLVPSLLRRKSRPPPQRDAAVQTESRPNSHLSFFSSHSSSSPAGKTVIPAKRVKRQTLPPLKASHSPRPITGHQHQFASSSSLGCCFHGGKDDGRDGGDVHGDDGLLGADGPLHPHPVPHMPGEEGGDEAGQHVQGQLRVGQIEFKNSELLCSLRKKSIMGKRREISEIRILS